MSALFVRRKWYVGALLLVLGAIATELLSKHHASRGMMAIARATAVPAERSELKQVGA